MRLTKPNLMPFQPVACESRDLCGDLFLKMNSDDLAKPRHLDYFPLGDMLTLPQNFGYVVLQKPNFWGHFVHFLNLI